MSVQVSFYASQKEKRLIDAFMEIHENATIRDLLRLLDAEVEDAAILIVNGESGTYKQALKEGDRVTLIPPLAVADDAIRLVTSISLVWRHLS